MDSIRWDLTPSIIKVLHVDDDELQWGMLNTFFNQICPKIQLTHISDPQEALTSLKNELFNCVLIGYKLPGINGLDLTIEIKKISKIPIILYTGQDGDEIAERAFVVGVDDFIRKELNPSHYQLLVKRIKDVVEKKSIEELYFRVVEEARDAISIIKDYKIVYANKALSEMLGYDSLNDVAEKNVFDYFVPLDKKEEYTPIIKSRINRPSSELMEYNARKQDGTSVPVETLSTRINYNGQDALLTFTRDITERKKTEVSLIKSESRFRSLVNLAPDGIITMDMRGNVTYVNPSFLRLTGFDENEILGSTILKLKTIRIKDIPAYSKIFAQLMFAEGNLAPIEFIYQRKDGSVGHGEGRARAVNTGGPTKEILVVARDITERKNLEEDLKVYSKELEKLAEERSNKLIESEKLIVTGSIASSLGHDLRGPLNTIRGAVYLMESRPEKTQEMLKMIDLAVDNSLKLLDELREKTKDFTLELEEVELIELIEEVLSTTLVPPEIFIKTSLHSVSQVRVDKRKIKRVFENLIRNASEAMPEGGDISISISEEDDNVRIDFADTGVGIPKEVLRNLFKPFVTTKATGTGLGLSFCKKTVEAHGGEISVKSKVGAGTIFSVMLKKIKTSTAPQTAIGQKY